MLKEFLNIAKEVIIIYESDIDSRDKYNLIFSDHISGKLDKLGMELDYTDPDSSYEEDVWAFTEAVIKKVEQLEPICNELIAIRPTG